MKKLTNKEYKLKVEVLEQDGNNASLKLISVKQNITLAGLVTPLLRQAPHGGFDDVKVMIARMRAVEAIEDLKVNEEVEVEDSVFDEIIEAGKRYKPMFVDREIIAFKEYIIELEEQSKLPKKKK